MHRCANPLDHAVEAGHSRDVVLPAADERGERPALVLGVDRVDRLQPLNAVFVHGGVRVRVRVHLRVRAVLRLEDLPDKDAGGRASGHARQERTVGIHFVNVTSIGRSLRSSPAMAGEIWSSIALAQITLATHLGKRLVLIRLLWLTGGHAEGARHAPDVLPRI